MDNLTAGGYLAFEMRGDFKGSLPTKFMCWESALDTRVWGSMVWLKLMEHAERALKVEVVGQAVKKVELIKDRRPSQKLEFNIQDYAYLTQEELQKFTINLETGEITLGERQIENSRQVDCEG